MNERDFVYWFNGFVELNKGKMPDPDQWESIKQHLALVFTKVTPKLGETQPLKPGTVPGLPNTPYYIPHYYDPNWTWPNEVTCRPTTFCSTLPEVPSESSEAFLTGMTLVTRDTVNVQGEFTFDWNSSVPPNGIRSVC